MRRIFHDFFAAIELANHLNNSSSSTLHVNGENPEAESPAAKAMTGMIRSSADLLSKYGEDKGPGVADWMNVVNYSVLMQEVDSGAELPRHVHSMIKASGTILSLVEKDPGAAKSIAAILRSSATMGEKPVLTTVKAAYTTAKETVKNPDFRGFVGTVITDREARGTMVDAASTSLAAWINGSKPVAVHANGENPNASSPAAAAMAVFAKQCASLVEAFADGNRPTATKWMDVFRAGIKLHESESGETLPSSLKSMFKASDTVLAMMEKNPNAGRSVGAVMEAWTDPEQNMAKTMTGELLANASFRGFALEATTDPKIRRTMLTAAKHATNIGRG